MLRTSIPDEAMETCYGKISAIIQERSKYAAKLGLWTQVGSFTSLDTSENMSRKFTGNPTKTAPIAVVQVNDEGYDGHLKVYPRYNSPKCTMQMLTCYRLMAS